MAKRWQDYSTPPSDKESNKILRRMAARERILKVEFSDVVCDEVSSSVS